VLREPGRDARLPDRQRRQLRGQQRLDIAAGRAAELGLQIRFVRADAADLHVLVDGRFDLVCSTNGFFVWLADLSAVFSEVARVLRPGGYYVFYDVHPFQRPWKDQVEPIEMIKPYWDKTPRDNDARAVEYRFHWTAADILNALASAGLSVHKVTESPAVDSRFWHGPPYGHGTDETLLDWRQNPRAGLPVWLTVAAEKL
jgi:SAM-dependent methyltransferase